MQLERQPPGQGCQTPDILGYQPESVSAIACVANFPKPLRSGRSPRTGCTLPSTTSLPWRTKVTTSTTTFENIWDLLRRLPPGSCCSTALSQILALRDGGLDYNFNGEQVHATIKLKGTADMKAVLEILAPQPAGSSTPCDQCECNKDYLHQSKEYLRSNGLMQPRTYKRLCMSGHLWGEEADLTEHYDCPFCHQHITGPGQFPAPGNSEHEKFPLQHAGKYPGKLPVVPMEPKDIIPRLPPRNAASACCASCPSGYPHKVPPFEGRG